jgi:adenylate cyclase
VSQRLAAVLDWLFGAEATGRDGLGLLAGLSAALRGQGVPLWRSVVQYPVLHPLYRGHSFFWWRDAPLEEKARRHDFDSDPEFLSSPYKHAIDTAQPLRVRLDGGDPGFPLLRALRARGATDFYTLVIPTTAAVGTAPGISWATDAPAGFADADIDLMRSLARFLGPAFELRAQRQTMAAVLAAYLGHGPGGEVMRGAIRRGESRELEAVVMLTDLRGSTATSLVSAASLLATLDTYFEVVVDAVAAAGGDVLKLMGDGVLALFPIATAAARRDRCRSAIAAVRGAYGALARANQARQAAGQAPLAFVTARCTPGGSSMATSAGRNAWTSRRSARRSTSPAGWSGSPRSGAAPSC